MPAVGAVHMKMAVMILVNVRVSAIGPMHVTRGVIVIAPRAVNVTGGMVMVIVM